MRLLSLYIREIAGHLYQTPLFFPEGRHHTEPQLIPSLETMWDPHIPLPLIEGNWATP